MKYKLSQVKFLSPIYIAGTQYNDIHDGSFNLYIEDNLCCITSRTLPDNLIAITPITNIHLAFVKSDPTPMPAFDSKEAAITKRLKK